MKITFIFPDLNVFQEFSRVYTGIFAHGIGYLSSSLKLAGHETSLIHVVEPPVRKGFIKRIKDDSPDLIAFTAFSHQFELVRKWSEWIKNAVDVPIVCGGVHATVSPDSFFSKTVVDIVCRGEGEETLVELCGRMANNKDHSDVKNLWVRKGNEIIKNEVRPSIRDLDQLPFPDRSIFEFKKLYDYKIRMLTILASRGCPFHCSYCCNHQYQKLYPQHYVRFRSVDNVFSEIDEMLRIYPDLEFVNFIDDTLCLNKSWLREFAEKYSRRFLLPFHGNTRVDLLDDESMRLLKEAGCERLDVGIESGNEYMRNEVLRRGISDEKINQAFELANKYGILLATYNMVGCPFERPSMIIDTIKMNARLKPYAVNRSIFQPYPHTDLYEVCIEKGFLHGETAFSFARGCVLEQSQLTRTQVVFFHRYFPILVKIYRIFEGLGQRSKEQTVKPFDRIIIGLSRFRIMLLLRPVIEFILMPLQSMKLAAVIIMPGFAREVKRVIHGRYYMKQRKRDKK